MNLSAAVFYIALGTMLGGVISLVPALHIFNVAGLILLLSLKFSSLIPGEILPYFMMAMLVSYSILNTIPSLFLGVPDDSTIFVVLPGQKYMLHGRGYEASVLTGIGALGGFIFIFLMTPLVFTVFPGLRQLLTAHMFWILALIITYMLMSEWPKGTDRAATGLGRMKEAWENLAAGIITFFLSGIMGIIILNKTLIKLESAFQGVMPVFVGLFAIPWLITNILSKTRVPPQHISGSVDLDGLLFVRGSIAGFLGGLFAAFFPVVTGGIGGLLAGHATAQRDDRLFVVSQGASKSVYYVGAFLLFFAPGLNLTRGGLAWMISPFFTSRIKADYYLALATIAISGAIAFFLLLYFSRLIIKLLNMIDYRILSYIVLFILLGIVYGLAGKMGLFLMLVGTGIGSIPVFFYSRRMNCMGVLLLPITLNMAGLGPAVNKLLGLI
mgnify:CR=1 FL=1